VDVSSVKELKVLFWLEGVLGGFGTEAMLYDESITFWFIFIELFEAGT
jgi:hypothetical protein